jgi:hypothetical protein
MTEEITETASNIGFFDLLRSRIRTVPFTMYRCLNHVLLDHRETWDFCWMQGVQHSSAPKGRFTPLPEVSYSIRESHHPAYSKAGQKLGWGFRCSCHAWCHVSALDSFKQLK